MGSSTHDNVDVILPDLPPVKPGMYLATVTGVLDNTFMGMLQVKLLYAESGNSDYKGQHIPVKYMSPFLGVTSERYVSQEDTYDGTQKSYGMWMVPPDVGTTVIVLFMQGSPKYGFYIGCVPDESMNFMVPGLAATKFNVDGEEERVPVGEYNRAINSEVADPTKVPKPQHPFTKVLQAQGLIKDDIRGITTSSSRRESPSSVFGISTPGPIDAAGPKGVVGTSDSFATVPISRLGGTTFVMDDGDDKFLRKTLAGEGPPEYASIEQDESDGLLDVPHNELVRIRTRTGHQILLHNSEDLIYIGNARGTTWVELTSNGKIDIFAEDSISIHTKNDLNIKADRDINLEAGRNVNIKAAGTAPDPAITDDAQNTEDIEKKTGRIQLESLANINLLSNADTKITSSGTSHINSGVNHVETASKVYMNSSVKADKVTPLITSLNPDETGEMTIESILKRVPTHEPWPYHENLDPLSFTPDKTQVETNAVEVPNIWNSYTLLTDTFEKFIRPNTTEG